MVEPGVWLAAVRQALIMDVQLPTLSPAAVALMLQRLVMVALHSPSRQLQGLAEAAWAPTCQSPAPVGMQLRGKELLNCKRLCASAAAAAVACQRLCWDAAPFIQNRA